MAHKTYRDPAGTTWDVWEVIPARADAVSEGLENGWLVFESGDRRLRFYPLPDQWQLLRDWQLEKLRAAAVDAPRARI